MFNNLRHKWLQKSLSPFTEAITLSSFLCISGHPPLFLMYSYRHVSVQDFTVVPMDESLSLKFVKFSLKIYGKGICLSKKI